MRSTLIVLFFTFVGAGCASTSSRQTSDGTGFPITEAAKPISAPEFNKSGANNAASAEYHFSLAQAYVAEGNPDRAIEEFKAALMYDQASGLLWARLAAEYVKKGMLSAAMDACKEALKNDPKFVDARLMLAGLYSTSRETDLALEEYNRVLKQDPSNEEAVIYKAQVLVEDSRAAEAIAELKKFLKRSPGSALGWYYLGKAEMQEEHFNEAVVAYRRAIDANDNFSQAALALAYAYESKGQNAKALEVYKQLFDASQDQTAAGRISTILLKENKYKEALPYLETQMRGDPEDMNVRVKYGLIEMELKNYDLAMSTFKYILERNPESDRVQFYLANLYEEQKDYKSAVTHFSKIGTDSRFYEEAVLHSAFLMKQQGQDGEAKTTIAEAIAKSPKVPGFYLFQASLEDESKNFTGAIAVLEKAITLFPDNERVRYYLGSLYDRQGDTAKGLFHMETIVQNNPENVDAMNYVAYTWTTQGIRLDDAEKLLKRALTLSPANGYIRDSWGWYLFTRGKISEAVTQLEQAAKMKPDEAVILEHLGDAYLRANLREKALMEYKDAAQYADEGLKQKLQGKIDGLVHDFASGSGQERHERVPASTAAPSVDE